MDLSPSAARGGQFPVNRYSAWQQNVALGLCVAALYFAWRYPGELVWDDTPAVAQHLYGDHHGAAPTSLADPAFYRAIWREEFGAVNVDGYRPLNWTVRRVGAACFSSPDSGARLLFVALNAVIAGLSAVVYYRLALRFVSSAIAALLAVFLLLASTPMLTGFLVMFAGIQGLVPLLICTALNCYFRSQESSRPALWLASMAVIVALGTWYREFVGLVPLLILFLQWQRGRLVSGTSLLAAGLFLHALFPTALLHAVWFPDLPLRPVFRLGALGEQAAVAVAGHESLKLRLLAALGTLQWRVLLDLASILPPTLLLLAAAGWLACVARHARWPFDWYGRFMSKAPTRSASEVGAGIGPRLRFGLVGDTVQAMTATLRNVSRSQAAFLGFFFALTFVPFLKVFKEQVHLAYCLVPAGIIVAASLEALWRSLAGRPAWRAAVAMLALVPLADHAHNLWIVRQATRHCYSAIRHVADVFSENVPPGSYVIANAHHLIDINLHSGGLLSTYFTARTGNADERFVLDSEMLENLLAQAGEADVYCLDVRRPVEEHQLGPDRLHHVVRHHLVDMEPHGTIARVSYAYTVIDPLKLLLPMQNVAWPTSPDLEFDFYRGPALEGTAWQREIAAEYRLYHVTGRTVRRHYPQPILLVDNYQRFNIVGYLDCVYAIPRPEGSFDLARVRQGGYSRTYQAATIRDVQAAIDRDARVAHRQDDAS